MVTPDRLRQLADEGFLSEVMVAFPDWRAAIRLFADAHFIISNVPLNDSTDPSGEGREIAGEWLAGFAALGEEEA
jgi:hypothetical protein